MSQTQFMNEEETEWITFIPVRAKNETEALNKAKNEFNNTLKWDEASIIHKEGGSIFVVRISSETGILTHEERMEKIEDWSPK